MRMCVEVLLYTRVLYNYIQHTLNMDVVAVSSDSECESEVIRPTSAVVFTPTSLNMDVV